MTDLDDRATRLISLFRGAAGKVAPILNQAVEVRVQVQPCICDIWHEHVLYHGDRVVGLVDFGSMRAESVAADLARLVGSMAGDDPATWRIAFEAYQSVSRLSEGEILLTRAFDQTTVLMAGLNWIDWIYRQKRVFDNPQAIRNRLDEILERLNHLCQH
jgi:Ser/Thr protein kinase RdoA (MazF antagonist)